MNTDLKRNIESFVKGDVQAFEEIYRAEYTRIFARTKTFMVGFSDADVEDVVQDIFIKVYEKLGTLEKIDAFEGWILRITRNTAINEIEKRKKIVFFQPISDEEETITQEDLLENEYIEFKPEEQLSRKEIEENLIDILNHIPAHLSMCFQMKEYDNMSYQEISTELGIPLSSVKNNIFQCKKKIKAEVEARKLYSVAPITFFLWLYRSYVEEMEVSAKNITKAWGDMQSRIKQIDSTPMPEKSGSAEIIDKNLSSAAISESEVSNLPRASTLSAISTSATSTATGGAIKIAAIAMAGVLIVGGGIFGVSRLINHQAEPIDTVEDARQEDDLTSNVLEQSDNMDDQMLNEVDDSQSHVNQETDLDNADSQDITEDTLMEEDENDSLAEEEVAESVQISNVRFDDEVIEDEQYFMVITNSAKLLYEVDGVQKEIDILSEELMSQYNVPNYSIGGYWINKMVEDVTGDGTEDVILHYNYVGNNLCDELGETHIYTMNSDSKELELLSIIRDTGSYKTDYIYNAGAFAHEGWLELNVATEKDNYAFRMAVLKMQFIDGDWKVIEELTNSSIYGDINELNQ